MPAALARPIGWLEIAGDLGRFCGLVFAEVFSGRVFKYFGEVLRQSGILIMGSTLVIWGLIAIVGINVGTIGAYVNRSIGAPQLAGWFTAWGDLREAVPYAFGWMMAAKVGTGLVAEIGAMRINEEIDAMEVMGIKALTFLASTRLLAAWLVIPFIYLSGLGLGFVASYVGVVDQIGDVSAGGYLQIFWLFQNPMDLVFSLIKAFVYATFIVLVGCYYGFTARGGPVGVGQATAKSMIVNVVLIHLTGAVMTAIFWGGNPNAPIGG